MITHQDLISFHNPSYFPSPEAWAGYQQLTRQALAAADHVAVLLRACPARRAGRGPGRAAPRDGGPDRRRPRRQHRGNPRVAPAGARRFDAEDELLLCLGTDFRHKNRLFALRTLDELQRRHDWTGWLLLAGPRVTYGSSRAGGAGLPRRSSARGRGVCSTWAR